MLGEKVKPYMFTAGGPIILAGLENEYGSFGNDKLYLKKLGELYRDCGIDVPLISANGSDPFKYKNGTLDESWNGIDCPANLNSIKEIELLNEYQYDKLPMVGEVWAGSMQIWGRKFSLNSNIESAKAFFERALNMNACVNFYMFCGGTNFGFTAGSLATLPGVIIKDHNTVEIFELHGQENLTNVSFIDHALLTEPVNNTESESNNFFLL